jgi:hypothetical protein
VEAFEMVFARRLSQGVQATVNDTLSPLTEAGAWQGVWRQRERRGCGTDWRLAVQT